MTRPTGAHEFARVVDAGSADALAQLTALPDLPCSRTEVWHAVSSVLLVTVDGRVLLARNRYGWGTVGGHVEESDRSLREAAVREAHEELGVLLLPEHLEPLALVVDRREVVPGCAHWDFCFVLPLASTIATSAQSDVTEAAWFPLDECPEVNDHMRLHLDALRAWLDGAETRREPSAFRVAARGVVQDDDRLLLLQSAACGDVKFPGGGVEAGESVEQALARELLEECGRTMIGCDPSVLTIVESRRDHHTAGLFTMVSHYLPCRVDDSVSTQALQGYEQDLGLRPEWLTVQQAITATEVALADGCAGPWAPRELAALRQLLGATGSSDAGGSSDPTGMPG